MTQKKSNKLNPRDIAKLVKHLRDAGAYHVEVKADGSVTADFPQPITYIRDYPWYWQRPHYNGPTWDTITTNNTTGIKYGGVTSEDSDLLKSLQEMGKSQAMETAGRDIMDGGPSGTFTNTTMGMSGSADVAPSTRVTFSLKH